MQSLEFAIEKSLMGCNAEDIIDLLVKKGVTQNDACQFVSNLDKLPGYKAARKISQQYLKLKSVTELYQQLVEQDTAYSYVPRVSALSRQKFFTDVWLRNKPVIITDFLSNSPAYKQWTFDSLNRRFGDSLVEVQTKRDSDSDYEYNSQKHKEKMLMSEFINRINNTNESNDFYMTCNNKNTSTSKLGELIDELTGLPDYVTNVNSKNNSCNFWIGPKGTHTPLHHDVCVIIHANFYGRKRWQLISPFYVSRLYNSRHVFSDVDIRNIDYKKFPLMQGVPIIDIVVEAGEALFLPLSWWHAVTSLSPCISMTFTGFPFKNHWDYFYPN